MCTVKIEYNMHNFDHYYPPQREGCTYFTHELVSMPNQITALVQLLLVQCTDQVTAIAKAHFMFSEY